MAAIKVDLENIGTKIKEIRKEKKLSQEELATLCGCSRTLISAYESGRVIPPLDKIEKIAAALDFNYLDLVKMDRVEDHAKLDLIECLLNSAHYSFIDNSSRHFSHADLKSAFDNKKDIQLIGHGSRYSVNFATLESLADDTLNYFCFLLAKELEDGKEN